MVSTREPRTDPVHPQSEAPVWNPSVSPDVDVELVGVPRGSLIVDPLQNFRFGPGPLTSSNYFPVALGGKEVVTEDVILVIRVLPVIEGLGYLGVGVRKCGTSKSAVRIFSLL